MAVFVAICIQNPHKIEWGFDEDSASSGAGLLQGPLNGCFQTIGALVQFLQNVLAKDTERTLGAAGGVFAEKQRKGPCERFDGEIAVRASFGATPVVFAIEIPVGFEPFSQLAK